jgi:hypothetical protein
MLPSDDRPCQAVETLHMLEVSIGTILSTLRISFGASSTGTQILKSAQPADLPTHRPLAPPLHLASSGRRAGDR